MYKFIFIVVVIILILISKTILYRESFTSELKLRPCQIYMDDPAKKQTILQRYSEIRDQYVGTFEEARIFRQRLKNFEDVIQQDMKVTIPRLNKEYNATQRNIAILEHRLQHKQYHTIPGLDFMVAVYDESEYDPEIIKLDASKFRYRITVVIEENVTYRMGYIRIEAYNSEGVQYRIELSLTKAICTKECVLKPNDLPLDLYALFPYMNLLKGFFRAKKTGYYIFKTNYCNESGIYINDEILDINEIESDGSIEYKPIYMVKDQFYKFNAFLFKLPDLDFQKEEMYDPFIDAVRIVRDPVGINKGIYIDVTSYPVDSKVRIKATIVASNHPDNVSQVIVKNGRGYTFGNASDNLGGGTLIHRIDEDDTTTVFEVQGGSYYQVRSINSTNYVSSVYIGGENQGRNSGIASGDTSEVTLHADGTCCSRNPNTGDDAALRVKYEFVSATNVVVGKQMRVIRESNGLFLDLTDYDISSMVCIKIFETSNTSTQNAKIYITISNNGRYALSDGYTFGGNSSGIGKHKLVYTIEQPDILMIQGGLKYMLRSDHSTSSIVGSGLYKGGEDQGGNAGIATGNQYELTVHEDGTSNSSVDNTSSNAKYRVKLVCIGDITQSKLMFRHSTEREFTEDGTGYYFMDDDPKIERMRTEVNELNDMLINIDSERTVAMERLDKNKVDYRELRMQWNSKDKSRIEYDTRMYNKYNDHYNKLNDTSIVEIDGYKELDYDPMYQNQKASIKRYSQSYASWQNCYKEVDLAKMNLLDIDDKLYNRVDNMTKNSLIDKIML